MSGRESRAERADRGSTEWFDELFGRYFARVYAYAVTRVGGALAEEVASETFVIAWRRRDVVPDVPLAWLIGVARNVIREQWRQEVRQDLIAAELHAWAATTPPVAGDVAELIVDRRRHPGRRGPHHGATAERGAQDRPQQQLHHKARVRGDHHRPQHIGLAGAQAAEEIGAPVGQRAGQRQGNANLATLIRLADTLGTVPTLMQVPSEDRAVRRLLLRRHPTYSGSGIGPCDLIMTV
ncbi:RNA polymerase sigma factor [Actinomadura nitritigenes]|uniref:RNA polymerase sigma factor n=1 Tax=Actinomadura nitritigenes TaxID=134602 RepID=UPI003D8AB858